MVSQVPFLGKFQLGTLPHKAKKNGLRDLLSRGPDSVLQIIGGPALDVLALQKKERQEGISFWDVRRIFYFQTQVALVKADATTERVWVLIARKEAAATLKGFKTTFFLGGFKRNYVARRFLKCSDLQRA